jgi:predicted transcriptional regulator
MLYLNFTKFGEFMTEKSKNAVIAVRVRSELREKAQQIAELESRTLSGLMNHLLREYVKKQEDEAKK